MPLFIQPMKKFPKNLLDGYRAFRAGTYANERELYEKLAEEGQAPETLVIACSDSRSAPGTIFNALPGEIFVVRNVANLVPPHEPNADDHATSAAIEFAVCSIGVKNIVVLGHCGCSGVKAALDPSILPDGGGFTGKWIDMLSPVASEVAADRSLSPAGQQEALERKSIANSIVNMRSFPFIAEREEQGRLSLHGAWFDVGSGELWVMDSGSGDFFRPDPTHA